MKLRFSKSDLINATQMVQSSISVKSTLPILSNLLLQIEKGAKGAGQTVRIEATDLEVGVRATVKAEILEEGKITLPAKKFSEMVKEMPDGKEIELITQDQRKVELRCGKIKASLVTLPPEDFPLIPEFAKSGSFKLNKATFREMIRKTAFAISTDETRHVLNGIYFMVSKGEIRMVATDGRRLALMNKNGAEANLTANLIIPNKAINELLRLLSLGEDKADDTIEISPVQNQVSFKWTHQGEEIILVSRVIDGTFPNYEQVIPKNKEIELRVNAAGILSAVRRASLFAQDRGGSIRMTLEKGGVKISANSQTFGEEEEELEATIVQWVKSPKDDEKLVEQEYKGGPFEIAFNPQFLLDALKNTSQTEVKMEFTTSLNPGLIKPQNDDQYLCVIMPMRLQ